MCVDHTLGGKDIINQSDAGQAPGLSWRTSSFGQDGWTAVAALLPVAMGFAVTFVVAQVWRLVAG